jgi:hypothetical protein
MFKTDEHSPDVIRILPKSLAVYHPNEQHKIDSSNNDEEHNPGQTEHEHKMYDQLDETQPFAVADGLSASRKHSNTWACSSPTPCAMMMTSRQESLQLMPPWVP